MFSFLQTPTITRRLLIWFLPIALLPLCLVLIIVHQLSREALETEATKNLISIADAKARRIEAYARDRIRDAALLAARPTMGEALVDFREAFTQGFKSPAYIQADKRFHDFLAYYVSLSLYEDLILVSASGDVVFSIRGGEEIGTNLVTGIYRETPLGQVYDRASTLINTEVSTYAYHPATNDPALFIATPIYDKNQFSLMGVMIVQVNNEGINRVINDYAGLGNTGEAVAALKDNDRVVVVTPLRHDSYAAFRRRLPLDDPRASHILQALSGQRGWVRGLDYRGVPVLSVQRYLPLFDWGLVVKIDQEELLGPITAQRHLILGVATATLFALTLAIVFIARSIARPITYLADAAQQMADGHLEQTITVTSQDEIGRLATTFNTMARQLHASYEALQGKLDTKAKALNEANQELRGLNALKTKLFSIISHDLRGSFNSLSMSLQMLNNREISQNDFYDLSRDLQTNSEGVQHLLENLLQWSRSQMEGASHRPTSLVLSEFVAELLRSLRALFWDKKISVTVDFPDDPIVYVDPDHLRLILRNLLSNACKFSHVGGKIHLSAQILSPSSLALRVRDEGVGIPAEKVILLNTTLSQHSESQSLSTWGTKGEKGTGLGVMLCRDYAAVNGGSLMVTSVVGQGTTVTVELPLATATQIQNEG